VIGRNARALRALRAISTIDPGRSGRIDRSLYSFYGAAPDDQRVSSVVPSRTVPIGIRFAHRFVSQSEQPLR
jgi:hypothetical protein